MAIVLKELNIEHVKLNLNQIIHEKICLCLFI